LFLIDTVDAFNQLTGLKVIDTGPAIFVTLTDSVYDGLPDLPPVPGPGY
jgi:hypothetical protein